MAKAPTQRRDQKSKDEWEQVKMVKWKVVKRRREEEELGGAERR
jgi:hypothetical protein